MIEIIPENSAKSTISFSPGVEKGGDCPWVKINNLYLSVTYTGENSWADLVGTLKKKGDAKFAVFTGRHGSQVGQAVDKTTAIVDHKHGAGNVFDKEHYAEDQKVVKKFKFDDCVTLIDCGTDCKTTEKLRVLAGEKLKAGMTVIFAWCFSIYAMDDFDENQVVTTDTAMAAAQKSVVAIVQASYKWVPR